MILTPFHIICLIVFGVLVSVFCFIWYVKYTEAEKMSRTERAHENNTALKRFEIEMNRNVEEMKSVAALRQTQLELQAEAANNMNLPALIAHFAPLLKDLNLKVPDLSENPAVPVPVSVPAEEVQEIPPKNPPENAQGVSLDDLKTKNPNLFALMETGKADEMFKAFRK